MFRNILSLAVQGTLRKKRSSILICSVLLISFSFAIVALSLVGSIRKTNAEFRLNTYGAWRFAIPSGMQEDAAWLEHQPWAEQIGTAGYCGTIVAASKQIALGTLDASLIEMGRITLESGRFPTADHEIAMEADALSALGYDYTLGQQIDLRIDVPYQDTCIPVERSYTLCGVIHEYSDLWVLDRNNDGRLLISAVVAQNAAQQVLTAAKECVTTVENRKLVSAAPQYFICVEAESGELARNALNDYLASSRVDGFGDRLVSENSAAYPEAKGEQYDAFYVYMIAAVTMIAVLCVYIIQLPSEIHSFAVLRSIGITKPQMALLLMGETLILLLPAILLGIPCGAGLTWLALRGMMYSGSVAIQVAIPYDALLTVVALWIAAVLASRLMMFAVTAHTPLTGRMQLQNQKSRRVKWMRSAMIVLLLGVFGAVTVFTGMETIRPTYLRKYWSLCPAYTIWKNTTVSVTETGLIEQIPGVFRVDGFGEMEIGLSFPGMEEQTVWIYAIDEENWTESLDFGKRKEAFHNGELVLMCFPEDSNEEYILPEGKITLRVYNGSEKCLVESSTDVQIMEIPENSMNRGLAAFNTPYTIFCSEAYLQRLLASMKAGEQWDKYIAGAEFGYDRVYVSADLNSDYLSTDVAMADFCAKNDLTLDNRRQQFQSLVQENVQTLILLYSAGICIALVVLLILASALSLEAEQERRYFGIMRAIGMSPRQMRNRIFGKALLRSMVAAIVGCVLYGGYSIIRNMADGCEVGEALSSAIDTLKYNGCDWPRALLIFGVCLMVPLVVSLLAKRKIKKGALVL